MQCPTTKQQGRLLVRACGKGLFAFRKSHKGLKGTIPLPLCKDVMVGALAVKDKLEHRAKGPCGSSQKRRGAQNCQ